MAPRKELCGSGPAPQLDRQQYPANPAYDRLAVAQELERVQAMQQRMDYELTAARQDAAKWRLKVHSLQAESDQAQHTVHQLRAEVRGLECTLAQTVCGQFDTSDDTTDMCGSCTRSSVHALMMLAVQPIHALPIHGLDMERHASGILLSQGTKVVCT